MEYSARWLRLVGSDGVKLDVNYFRSFKIGRLYYKYIRGTEFEKGWTWEKTEALAAELEREGFIKIVTVQSQDKENGQWENGEKRYVEVTGKSIKRSDFIRMLKLGLVFVLMLTGCGKEVDARAVPYLDTFRQEAVNRAVQVNILGISVVVDESITGIEAAKCEWGAFGKTIRIGPRVPLDGEYRLSVEAVFFHELGHCALGKDHVTSDSIMNPTTPIHSYPSRRKEYLDEFFTAS